jgi:hypothetical protein
MLMPQIKLFVDINIDIETAETVVVLTCTASIDAFLLKNS